jgi:hypothetical protein
MVHCSAPYTSSFVEVIGRVNPDRSVQEYRVSDFGDNFHLDNYEQLVQLSTKEFKELF